MRISESLSFTHATGREKEISTGRCAFAPSGSVGKKNDEFFSSVGKFPDLQAIIRALLTFVAKKAADIFPDLESGSNYCLTRSYYKI